MLSNGTNQGLYVPSRMLIVQKKLSKFFMVGVLSTATHYIILFTLLYGLHIELVVSTTVGAIAGAIVNYIANYFYTFSSQRNHSHALIIFMLVVSVGLLLNATVVFFAFHHLSLPVLISQIIATLLTFIWNYLAHQRWTF